MSENPGGILVQPLTGRRRAPGLIGAALALVVLALAVTASTASATDLVPGAPANPTAGFFDDHSISGDNHAGWGPTEEPLAVRFTAAVGNVGPAIAFCGTPAAAGWMAATQGACGAGGPQFGWFRYVTANHFGHNRWQLMDFQRFALVNVNPGGTEVIWDTRWGSCVNNSAFAECSTDPNAPLLNNMGFLPDSTKVTQDGADEDQIIAIPNQLGYRLPEGNWQILHWVNPYGAIAGDPTANNVTCTPITLSWAPATAPAASPLIVAARPLGAGETCRTAQPPPAVTGPGDPADSAPLRAGVPDHVRPDGDRPLLDDAADVVLRREPDGPHVHLGHARARDRSVRCGRRWHRCRRRQPGPGPEPACREPADDHAALEEIRVGRVAQGVEVEEDADRRQTLLQDHEPRQRQVQRALERQRAERPRHDLDPVRRRQQGEPLDVPRRSPRDEERPHHADRHTYRTGGRLA